MSAGSIGPYRILEPLGAGAHGDVFLAEDTRLGRRVALKTLRDLATRGLAETRKRMLREARAAARLNHPNIAAVYDVIETPDALHIVMEHVPGTTLAARLRQGALQPLQVLDLGVQLASALAHAHGQGVIHRDLKPGNIVLTSSGQAKILDFGVARTVAVPLDAATQTTPATEERVLVGTPPYMPPEHIMGSPVDERGDLYSLGVTLFEALTGRRPFDATDFASLARAILNDPTPRAGTSVADLPHELDAVVYRAMERDPTNRYATALDLESDLKRMASRVLDGSTVSRFGVGAMSGPRRRPLMATAVAAAAVILALGAFALTGGRRLLSFGNGGGAGPPGPHVVAVLPLLGSADDPQHEALAAGVSDALITALSKLEGVTVVSRATMLKHRDRKQDPDAIAAEVGASLMVDGSLQRERESLRVTLSLLRPGSKVVDWQQDYDGDFKNVLTLQREVAAAVAETLRLKLSAATREGIQKAPTTSVEALADYSQARAFLERPDVQGNVDRSIELFQSAIRKDPAFALAHAGLGEAYWRHYRDTRQSEWSVRASEAIATALRLDPNDAAVRYSLAMTYRGTGRLPEAIEQLRETVTVGPAGDDPHRLLGQLLAQTGQETEGLAHLQKAIDLRPSYSANHQALGIVHYNAGRYAAAIPPLKRAVELQPDSGWGYQVLGTAYHAMDDTTNARANYEKAIAFGDAKAHSNLGALLFSVGDLEGAARSYREALKLEPNSIKHHGLGDVYAIMGRKADARVEYTKAVDLCHEELRVNPRAAGTLSRLALAEAKLGRARDADAHMRDAVGVAPANSEVRFAEAILRVLTGEPDKALVALEQAIEHGYSRRRAAENPFLAPLRSRPRYSHLLTVDKPGSTDGGGR
jgi:tetratricopeptide (TPR) repeat protein/TolB-like protein